MAVFSRRNGYNKSFMKQGEASETLKNRIYYTFYKREYVDDFIPDIGAENTKIEDMMIEMGRPYNFPKNNIIKQRNSDELECYLIENSPWYSIYDFIEKYIDISNSKDSEIISEKFNKILEQEGAAYRIVDGLVVPITNEMELAAIEGAMETPYEAVNVHIVNALSLFSDRKSPDYKNTIKEAISAVESICAIITNSEGSDSMLSKSIKRLKDKGIHIHPLLEQAIKSLYNYTCDESGIRHGGDKVIEIYPEDAKYMLVTCSAIVNYLIEKQAKVISKGE